MNVNADSTREPISVVLVDDHELARQGVRNLLRRDKSIKIVGEASNRAEAQTLISSKRPDVVLLDIRLGDESGIELAREVKASIPEAKILILSAYGDKQYVAPVARLGVSGYLMKSASSLELIRAIHEVAGGGMVFGPEVAGSVKGLLEDNASDTHVIANGKEILSAREMEVLSYLSTGFRNNEIASEMRISLRTVETHVGHILVKLDARTRTQAVLNASSRGWV